MKRKGLFDGLIDSMAYVAGLLLVAAVLIVSLEICMRYFFQKPQIWTVEVCEFILFIMAFLGAPWLLKKGGHASVDILVEKMSPVLKRYASLFASFARTSLFWHHHFRGNRSTFTGSGHAHRVGRDGGCCHGDCGGGLREVEFCHYPKIGGVHPAHHGDDVHDSPPGLPPSARSLPSRAQAVGWWSWW